MEQSTLYLKQCIYKSKAFSKGGFKFCNQTFLNSQFAKLLLWVRLSKSKFSLYLYVSWSVQGMNTILENKYAMCRSHKNWCRLYGRIRSSRSLWIFNLLQSIIIYFLDERIITEQRVKTHMQIVYQTVCNNFADGSSIFI